MAIAKTDKIRVGLLGGAFDPITSGHLALAKCAIKNKTVDKVWFVPCFSHKFGKEMSDSKHRLNMCKLVAQRYPRIGVFDYEIKHRMNGQTYDLVSKILENDMMCSIYSFRLLIGQDNADNFSEWYKGEELRNMIPIITIARKGLDETESQWYEQEPHIYLKGETGVPEISSTQIREHLAYKEEADEFVRQYVDKNVTAYIFKHKLYNVQ